MKRTYVNRLPKNEEVKNTNVRIENGELVVEVEFKEKIQPKDGDFLCDSLGFIFIYNDSKPYFDINYCCYCGVNIFNKVVDAPSNNWAEKDGCRFATTEEKSAFLERLEKECHKRWNEETKQLEDIRWIPNINERYYYIDSRMCIGKIYNVQSALDKEMTEKGNCFKTVEAAQKVADQIKEIFKNSKAE